MIENIWLSIHLVGVVIGAGSVTTAYARELYFKWHPENIEQRGILPVISSLLNIGFALLVISGFGLYLENPQTYNTSTLFWIKISLVGLLLFNHILINAYLRTRRGQMKIVTTISEYFSLIGWYIIIVISVFM